MSTNQLSRKNKPAIHPAICLIGVLLAFFAAYAHSQQIHQISFNGSSWMDQNLNGALASGFTGIAAFQTTPNQQTHVYYVDNSANYDVHQLFYNGTSWSDEDLTVVSGASRGAIGPSAVAGFPVGNFQYVYYIGSESDVHQLLYDNARWTDTDLSATAGGPIAYVWSLVAFTTTPALHVYYIDGSRHIHQLFSNDGTHWADQDLTSLTGGTTSEIFAGQMGGFNIDNFQYLYFVASDGHVHQFLYNNTNWSDEDLTALSKSPAADPYSGAQALVIPGTKKLLVYFMSTGLDHIVQLSSTDNKKWTKIDLTKKAVAPGGAGLSNRRIHDPSP